MSEYIDRVARGYGQLMGHVEVACADLLTTTDLAEVHAIARRLRSVLAECHESSKLEKK